VGFVVMSYSSKELIVMNRKAPHFQSNNVPNWPSVLQYIVPDTWVKVLDDVGMSETIVTHNPTLNVVMRFHRDWMQQFDLDIAITRQRARDFLNTFINPSFLLMAQFIKAIEDFNEYWAASHTEEETQMRILWVEQLLWVWENEFLPRYPELNHLKWCLGNAAIGNDIPWQVAKMAADRGHYIGYHAYISIVSKDYRPANKSFIDSQTEMLEDIAYRENMRDGKHIYRVPTRFKYLETNATSMDILSSKYSPLSVQPTPGERSPDEFIWGSGRILMQDLHDYQPRNIRPEYIVTEGGPIRDLNGRGWLQPNDGWRHRHCLNGNMQEYIRLTEEVYNLYRIWNSENGDRLRGYVDFTSGAHDWKDFILHTGDLETLLSEVYLWPGTPPAPEPEPEPEPEPTPDYSRGIDISHWQGSFNPEQSMQEAGDRFVFIKASDGWGIWKNKNKLAPKGENPYIDPRFEENTNAAIEIGLFVGSYHFFQPGINAITQASNFVEALNLVNYQNLPPVIDLEVFESGITIDQYRDNVIRFLEHIETTFPLTPKPLIYTSVSFYNQYLATDNRFLDYPLWIANWRNGTQPYLPFQRDTWDFWQYSNEGDGSFHGVESQHVDLNYFNGTTQQLENIYQSNWMETGDVPFPDPPLVIPCNLREQYKRIIHIIGPDATEQEQHDIWQQARKQNQTISWSFDEGGASPCQTNLVRIWGIPAEDQQKYIDWYTWYYPNASIEFRPFLSPTPEKPLP
jgi:GH25 family lysozyme M1 (1,4-beta-N-acetylmuramidase)